MGERLFHPTDFMDPNDRTALENLKNIPGFTPLIRAFMKIWDERFMKIENLSSKVQVTSEQLPRLYNLLYKICDKFQIEVPDIYLKMDPSPNACTSGDTYIYIEVTAGLLAAMEDELLEATLVHEVGHILCHHVLYTTIADIIIDGAVELLGLGPVLSLALKVGFFWWRRCAEYSADNAVCVYSGGPDMVVNQMLRFAGGTKMIAKEINAELFLKQAEAYYEYTKSSAWNKILEFIAVWDKDHPFTAVRAAHAVKFCSTERFRILQSRINGEEQPDLEHCPKCGARIEPEWAFCKKCGQRLH